MMMNEGRRGRVRAVRLPHVLTNELERLAAVVGGYSKAIEMLAAEQELPRGWFLEHRGEIRHPRDTRITFRLSVRGERALRAWGGRRPLSKIVAHLIVYSFTEGLGARLPAIVASLPVPPTESPGHRVARASAPPGSPALTLAQGRVAKPPAPMPAKDVFDHLPALRAGLSYVCEIPDCDFARGSGVVVRCRLHTRSSAPAFDHLPRLPRGHRYICQRATCRFVNGDGVATGATIVAAFCREHAL
jgi:hypothetical protein